MLATFASSIIIIKGVGWLSIMMPSTEVALITPLKEVSRDRYTIFMSGENFPLCGVASDYRKDDSQRKMTPLQTISEAHYRQGLSRFSLVDAKQQLGAQIAVMISFNAIPI